MKNIVILVSYILLSLFTILPAEAATTPKKWTFIIFMNGNNSLDDFTTQNLKSMEQVGSNEDINIVVQWASYSSKTVKRLYIEKSTDPKNVTSPILAELGSVDMGDYRNLEAFIKWSVENYPAEHYFIDVWDHGSGWSYKRSAISRDISVDDLTGNVIKTEQLAEAMAYAKKLIGHNVDIYGSDACLMAMAEVATEMSGSVDYFVGSQELEPGDGWPYEPFLHHWESQPNITPKEVATTLVNDFVDAYSDGVYGNYDATLSAYDMALLSPFNSNVALFAKEVQKLPAMEREKIFRALKNVRHFYGTYGPDFVDLADWLNKINVLQLSHLDQKIITNLHASLNKLVIHHRGTEGYENAFGLSIWMPKNQVIFHKGNRDKRYNYLKFNQATHWESAIEALLQDAN